MDEQGTMAKRPENFWYTDLGHVFSNLIHDTRGGQALMGNYIKRLNNILESKDFSNDEALSITNSMKDVMKTYVESPIDHAYVKAKKLGGY